MDRSTQGMNRLAWALLGGAMGISALWLMLAGSGLTFTGDDVFYYARFVDTNGNVVPGDGLEYFLAPHNGHLVLIGKLVYRALLVTVGADYAAFRAAEVAAVLACAVLFFVLAKRRVGPIAALIPSVLLLFLGYAGESLLWPFNLHTVLALAFGLAALLTLERDDRRGEIATCVLLALSVATVELGLAFAIGVAISVLSRPDRLRRLWIFAVPLVLFAIWWLWAQRFGQSTFEIANVRIIPITLADALAAVVGSIFGLNPTGEDVPSNITTVTPWGSTLAALAVVGLGWRIRRGAVPLALWMPLAIIVTYWLMIAMAGRPADSTRYVFVGVGMVLLVAAAALRGTRISNAALIGAACIVAIAIPPNIAKFYDARRSTVEDAENTRTEYAMIELARESVAPDYIAATDQRVLDLGGSVFVPLSAANYLRAASEFGSLAYPLEQIRDQSLDQRRIADASLVGALDLRLRPAPVPSDPGACPSSRDGARGASVFFSLPRGGILLGSQARRPVKIAVGRFGYGGPGVELGRLESDQWAELSIPPDAAPDRWWVTVDGPVYACPPPSPVPAAG